MFILFILGVVLLSFISLLFLLIRWRAIGRPVANTDSNANSNIYSPGFQSMVLNEKPVGVDDHQWAVLVQKRDEIEDDPLIDEPTRESMRQQWFLMVNQVFHRTGLDGLQIISRPLKSFPITMFLVAVLATTSVVYAFVGNWTPQALAVSTQNRVGHVDQSMPSGSDRHPGEQLTMQERIEALEVRLKQQPDDLLGWALLSRAKASQRDFAGSVAALEKALALSPDHPDILADMADMVAMTQNSDMRGRPLDLVMQALKSDPNNAKALALAATAAEQVKDQPTADMYWSRLRKVQESQQADQTQPNDISVNTEQVKSAAVITGTVAFSSALQAKLKTLPSSAVLYITAKALTGPPMPLAVLRFPVSALESGGVSFQLDDNAAMTPQMRLSLHEKVNLEARVSIGGQATKASGDWAKTLGGVRVGETGVSVLIDTVLP